MIDASTTAARIAFALAQDSRNGALRAFLDYSDELTRYSPAERFGLAAINPGPTGSAAWDAALAGLVDFNLAPPKPGCIEKLYRLMENIIPLAVRDL